MGTWPRWPRDALYKQRTKLAGVDERVLLYLRRLSARHWTDTLAALRQTRHIQRNENGSCRIVCRVEDILPDLARRISGGANSGSTATRQMRNLLILSRANTERKRQARARVDKRRETCSFEKRESRQTGIPQIQKAGQRQAAGLHCGDY